MSRHSNTSTTAASPADASGARTTTPGSAGQVLDLIRRTGGLTRAEILERTGLARSTVTSRLGTLESAGLITPGDATVSGRGRPASRFHFRQDAGALLLSDAGATGVRTALTDLDGTVVAERKEPLGVAVGPEAWLDRVNALFEGLMTEAEVAADFVHGIGLALPGPVDFASGTVVQPPIMTGWDGFPIRAWFARHFGCPVIVDKDVNVMATGEYVRSYHEHGSMLMLKIATGIGSGIIANGGLYRGADGAAGDLGHIQLGPHGENGTPRCRCGNDGCVEAYASGWALVRDLRERGRDVADLRGLVDLARAGDPTVTAMTRDAGRTIGIAIADAVSLLNPAVVVVGGDLANAAPNLVAGIRESVYARCLPLATRRLQITPSSLGSSAGLIGLALTMTDHLYAPARIDASLAT